MKCVCGADLIQGGVHDAEPPWLIVSNFSCSSCLRQIEVYEPDLEDSEWST